MKLDVDIYLKQGSFLLDAEFKSFESALGIFGPSGCGKSTLFRALAGLVRPDGGHIVLDGEPLFDSAQHIFVPPHKRSIGLVFQDARLFPHWSVEQNLRAGEHIKQRVVDRPFSYADMVDLLDIGHLIERSVEQLSGGEKQRIAIGRTLLSNPRMLLMDEPVTGLDASLKMQILPFLTKVHQTLEIPTILISHDLGEILQLTDHLLLMREGRAVGCNTLEKLIRNPQTLKELKGADLTNLIRVRVKQHNENRGITELRVYDNPEEIIRMEWCPDYAPGTELTIGIAANQIALASERIESISMRNQLPGYVAQIVHASDRSICHIETSAGLLFAEITPGTEQDMNLKIGAPIWALFKGLSIQRL
ncbi:molybdenum ABC transporter ATP-binding protein [Pontiellaceae bacterium B12219]|nr:molybdenum ABC transporter ATP-binding protein [Pontiellaceae bacterium B12219]